MTPNQTALLEALRVEEGVLAGQLADMEATARKLAAVRYLIEIHEPCESIGSEAPQIAQVTAPEPQNSAGLDPDPGPDVTTPSEPEEIAPEPQETAIPEATSTDERIDPIDAELESIKRKEKERDALLTELWPTDLSVADIGERVGRSAGWVSNRAKAIGLPTRAGRNRRDEPALKADREAPTDDDGDERPVVIGSDAGAGSSALMSLTPNGCKWPIGDPKDPDFRFCGKARGAGPYCEGHQRMSRARG